MAKFISKILLLLVEDEMNLAQMYASKLSGEGFKVDIAHDGDEGFEKMHTEKPSLVIMDILLPGLDGLEALRKAKADSQTKDIPIIILTNMSDANYANQAAKEGAADYIVKAEITPSQLVQRVKQILAKQVDS